MFSNHSGIRLGTHSRKISGKYPNILKLNNILLCNPWIKKEIQWETREYFELNENEDVYIILGSGRELLH